MLNKIEEMILYYKNKSVEIKVNNIRNKSEYINGVITELYERVFVVLSSDGIRRSFNYSDILTGTIEIVSKIY